MTTIILARLYDNSGGDIGLEVFEGDSDPEDIIDTYKYAKSLFGHTIQAELGTYCMFTDGTRVELSMYKIQRINNDKGYRELQ